MRPPPMGSAKLMGSTKRHLRVKSLRCLDIWLLMGLLAVVLATGGCSDAKTGGSVATTDLNTGFDTGGADSIDPGSDTAAVEIGSSDIEALHCPGGPLCACNGDGECDTGICLDSPKGRICAALCESSGCPGNYSCAKVNSSTGDIISLCVPKWGYLCEPCTGSKACEAALGVTGMACVDYGKESGAFCGATCGQDSDCPSDYACSDATTIEGKPAKMCVRKPVGSEPAVCPCDERSINQKLSTTCTAKSDIGTCNGYRICEGAGLGTCTAPKASTETCDNIDNDCNGLTDDGLCDDKNICTDDQCQGASKTCQNTNNTVVCSDGSACTDKDLCAAGKCAGITIDCDDKNVCTTDLCDTDKGCVHNAISGECNDGDDCTVGDACKDGACGAGKPKDCDDGNPCTQDTCDVSTGKCAPKILDGAPCSDGNACTTPDNCSGDVCKGGPVNCDDKNPCTDDVCDPGNGCANTANTTGCSDGNACTLTDTCDGKGSCVGAPIDASVTCNDNNPCTQDVCDQGSGCINPAQAATCEDGNPCTNGDQCTAGKCKPGQNICGCEVDLDCAPKDDGNPCNGVMYCNKAKAPYVCEIDPKTIVVCDSSKDTVCSQNLCSTQTGSCAPVSAPDTKACNGDDSVCTQNDMCKGGICTAGAVLNCDDGNPCTDDLCDPKDGCKNVANTVTCSDGNGCTVGDVCASAQCVPGPLTVCNDDSVCTTDSCVTSTGKCKFDAAPFEGGSCDADGSKCTVDDHCVAGKCAVGTTLLQCADSNPCTDESCDSAKGCVKTNNNNSCDYDGDPCTPLDTCKNGNCTLGPAKDCDDKNVCTLDKCDSATGNCVHPAKTDGANCEDGDMCTSNDTCKAGACTSGVPTNCDDGDQCTLDSCSKTAGCSNKTVADKTACSDGDACTYGDVCTAGQCAGALVNCDDSNVCTDDICGTVGCEHKPKNDTTTVASSCDGAKWCVAGACKIKGCGDGYLDGKSGEACDDGNALGCDACEGCQFRGVLLLDGKGSASAAVTPQVLTYKGDLGLAHDLTLEAWVRPESLVGDTYVVSKGQVTAPAAVAWSLGLEGTTGNVFFAAQGPDGGEKVTGTKGASLKVWTHVAVVVAGELVRFYVNGLPAGTGTLFKVRQDVAGVAVVVGKRYVDLDVGNFIGAIDAIRISNGPLYGAPFVPVRVPGVAPDTRALWLFDDPPALMGNAPYSSDSSGNLNSLPLGTGSSIGPDACYGGAANSSVCGDGIANPAFETCDDKNADACDGCVDCKVQRSFDASATNTAYTPVISSWASDAFCPTCEVTVEAWVKLSATPSGAVVVVGTSCSNYFGVIYSPGLSKFGVSVAGSAAVFADQVVAVGQWYHLAVAIGFAPTAPIRMYLDGKLLGTGAIPAAPVDVSAIGKEVLWVGAGSACVAGGGLTSPNALFPGLIDDVRVSQGMRYTDSFKVPPKRLRPDRQTRGLWHFDEPVGATAFGDDSGAGVALTANKTVWTNDQCWGQTGAAACGDGQVAKYELCDAGAANGPASNTCGTACTPPKVNNLDNDCSMVTWSGSTDLYNAIMYYGTPWTVEGWVKLNAMPAIGVTGWIAGVADAASGCGQPAKQEWYVATAADGTDASQLGGAGQTSSTATKVWRKGEWQHFAIQYEGFNKGSLWVDGYKARSFANVSTSWFASCAMMLGNSKTGKFSSASLASLRFSKSVRYGQPFLPSWRLLADAASTWLFEFTGLDVGGVKVFDTTSTYWVNMKTGPVSFVADGPQCK